MNNSPEKILIIRLSSIGDILLSTPFIRQTRTRFPEARIDFVIKEKFYNLISENPHLNDIFQLQPGNLNKLIQTIRLEKYDYIFDLHRNIRSIVLTIFAGSKRTCRIKKNKLIQQMLVKFKINLYDSEKPIPERYLEVGHPVGIMDDKKGLEFFWSHKAETRVKKYFNADQLKIENIMIAVAPGAGFYTKRWPTSYFSELMDMIRSHYHASFVILGDRHETEMGKELSKGREWVLDLTGKLGLMDAGALLAECQLAITNDSGLMHLATAVQTPVLAIFGSSVREFGFFPYRGANWVLERKNLNCRPCSHIGRKTCPRGHFKCMLDLTPAVVMKKIGHILTGLKTN